MKIGLIYTLFLPKLHELREKFKYDGKAVIILDSLKAHHNIVEKIDAEKENIVFHFLVAYLSDQTQPLDLGLFGIMKKFQQNFL